MTNAGNVHDLWKRLDESEKECHMLRMTNADLAGALDNLSLEFNAAKRRADALGNLNERIAEVFLARGIAKLGDRLALDKIKELMQEAAVELGGSPFAKRGKVGGAEPQ